MGAPDGGSACAATALTNCWSDAPTDTWVVGTLTVQPAPGMFESRPYAFHWNGCAWTRATLPASAMNGLDDVWGAGPSDVWAVGFGGLTLHFDGTAWTQVAIGSTSSENAVSGTSGHDVWIGAGDGLFHFDGAAWSVGANPAGGRQRGRVHQRHGLGQRSDRDAPGGGPLDERRRVRPRHHRSGCQLPRALDDAVADLDRGRNALVLHQPR